MQQRCRALSSFMRCFPSRLKKELSKLHVFLTTYTSLKQCENTNVEKAMHFKEKHPSDYICSCWYSVMGLASMNVLCIYMYTLYFWGNSLLWGPCLLMRFAFHSIRNLLIHKTRRETTTLKRNSRICCWNMKKKLFSFLNWKTAETGVGYTWYSYLS